MCIFDKRALPESLIKKGDQARIRTDGNVQTSRSSRVLLRSWYWSILRFHLDPAVLSYQMVLLPVPSCFIHKIKRDFSEVQINCVLEFFDICVCICLFMWHIIYIICKFILCKYVCILFLNPQTIIYRPLTIYCWVCYIYYLLYSLL